MTARPHHDRDLTHASTLADLHQATTTEVHVDVAMRGVGTGAADLMFFPTMSSRQATTDGPGRCQELESLHQHDPYMNESENSAPRPYCDVQ